MSCPYSLFIYFPVHSRFLVKFSLSKLTVHFSRAASVPSPYLAPAGVLQLFHWQLSAMRTVKCQAGEKCCDSVLHAHHLLWGIITGAKSKQSFPPVIPSTSPFLPASISHSEEEQLLKRNKWHQKVQHVLAFKKFGTATAFTACDSGKPHQRHRSVWSKQHVISGSKTFLSPFLYQGKLRVF